LNTNLRGIKNLKRKLLVAVPILIAVGMAAWLLRPKHEAVGEAYISERSVTLWSGIAQVREPIDTLHYGDRVDVTARRNDNVRVRTVAGEVGWVDARLLMEPGIWRRSAKLLTEARDMPVQARGRTKVQTNLRLEPGRKESRVYQFGRGVPVEIVGRAVADWAQATDEKEIPNDRREAKKEDWFLVRGVATRPLSESAGHAAESATTQPGDQTLPIAGWVISRFIELDLPDPVRQGTASANVRPVAWFELNRVAGPSGDQSQYLVAGTRGPEGQPCDFTTLRVYTWNPKKTRYETAFIENDLCGQMPVRVGKSPKGEPEFRFRVMDGSPADRSSKNGSRADGRPLDAANDERVYRLIQTVVRRIRDANAPTRTPPQGKTPPRPAK
jgi:hypothetical protein